MTRPRESCGPFTVFMFMSRRVGAFVARGFERPSRSSNGLVLSAASMLLSAACAGPAAPPVPANLERTESGARDARSSEAAPEAATAGRAPSRRYAVVQLDPGDRPWSEVFEALDAAGIRVLEVLISSGPRKHLVSLPASLDTDGLSLLTRRFTTASGFVPFQADTPGSASSALAASVAEEANAALRVVFQRDVTSDEAEFEVRSAGLRGRHAAAPMVWDVEGPGSGYEALLRSPLVALLVERPEPIEMLMRDARVAAGVDAAQSMTLDPMTGVPSFTYSGAGIKVGICDEGIDHEHDDFTDPTTGSFRVDRQETASSPHGTLVAGIALGGGQRSAQWPTPGKYTPFALRGVAPRARLFEYSAFGGSVQKFAAAATAGVHVTNHSYELSIHANYESAVASVDEIIAGRATYMSAAVPGRVQVWAAGNNGFEEVNGGHDIYSQLPHVGYFSILCPAKNPIAVGSCDLVSGKVSKFSSLGPTQDGRIKPDLVAPATLDSYSNSADLQARWSALMSSGPYPGPSPNRTSVISVGVGNQYAWAATSGTSFAAPMVTGVVALVMEAWGQDHGDPLLAPPALWKAVLVQSADDLVWTAGGSPGHTEPDTGSELVYGEGPDWASGFGRVNAAAAVETASTLTRTWTGVVLASGHELRRTLEVAAQGERIAIALAWDDPPASLLDAGGAPIPPATDTSRLVNDLEVELIAPDGSLHLPWTMKAPPAVTAHPIAAGPGVGALTPGQVTPAFRGRDDRNNVELVTVESPAVGAWTVVVRAHDLGLGQPQRFGLASSHELALAKPRIETLCERFPTLCSSGLDMRASSWVADEQGRLPIDFGDQVLVRDLCQYAVDCPGCDGPAWSHCGPLDLGFSDAPEGTRVLLLDLANERLVAESSTSGDGALQITIPERSPMDEYSLVFVSVDRAERFRTRVTVH